MADNLKQKTTNSFLWNAFDKVGFQTIALIVGIITARLLSPKDFGLIGALAIFTLLSNTLVESGFSLTMIRRNNNTNAEYSAVFYFNLLAGILFYTILFFAAPSIALFFDMPELCDLSRILFLSIVLNSLGLVQNIILTKKLAFKILTIVNIISVFLSGVITIILIYTGFGYWALAWQLVLQVGFRSFLLWVLSSWRLTKQVDFRVIKELFSFSIFLLANSIFVAIVKYIYNIIIGRLYTVQDLGYYSQAYKYQQIPSSIISNTISGVAFPVLSELNNNPRRQLTYFRKIVRITAFAIFPIMIMFYLLAEPLFSIVLTDKWLPAVPYFQILVIAGIVVPFHTLNLSLITVKGFPKRMFLLEIIRNLLVILSVIIFFQSILTMLYGFLIASILSYLTGLFFIERIIRYRVREQIVDILPYGVISVVMGVVIKGIEWIGMELYLTVFIQLATIPVFYIGVLKLFGSRVLEDVLSLFKFLSPRK